MYISNLIGNNCYANRKIWPPARAKLFSSRLQRQEGTQFIKLFDILEKSKDIDDDAIRKKLGNIAGVKYANLKRNLYSNLLTSLRLIHSTKKADLEIREQMRNSSSPGISPVHTRIGPNNYLLSLLAWLNISLLQPNCPISSSWCMANMFRWGISPMQKMKRSYSSFLNLMYPRSTKPISTP